MPLVWVTGNSGAGKSTVCALLAERGEVAVDADWEGFSHWVDRTTGEQVEDPPYPVPDGWLRRFAWRIDRRAVEELAERGRHATVFLCGSVENEDEVWGLFDCAVCLAVDDTTIRARLAARTTNAFGKHPDELVAVLRWNEVYVQNFQRLGATIVDGTLAPDEVADAVIAAANGFSRRPSNG